MTSAHPECDKMLAVHDQSQVIGEFLEWLDTQGLHIMQWRTFNEPKTCTCIFNEGHTGERYNSRTHKWETCGKCNGTGLLEETYEVQQWTHARGSINEILARFFDIDMTKVEQERRAMLEQIRNPS